MERHCELLSFNNLKICFAATKQIFKLLKVDKALAPVGNALKGIGSTIFKVLKGAGGIILKIIKNLPGIKQIGQVLNLGKNIGSKAIGGIKSGFQFAKTGAAKVGSKLKNFVTGGGKKVASGIMKKGLAKAPGRLFLKLFGKKGAKAVASAGKAFKTIGKAAKAIKIPILGPIIVAVTSMLSGDPMQQTLFKAIGAGLGGAIGTLGGPLGMIVGEIVGEFLGNFLYEMFLGKGKGQSGKFLKESFMNLVSGAGKYGKMFIDFVVSQLGKLGNFFKDGFKRFTEDFPTVKIPEKFGVQTAMGKIAGVLGLDEKSKFIESGSMGQRVTSIPDLSLLTPFGLPKLLPLLKNSFFPSGEKEQVPDSETSVSKTEETDETTSAVVATEDNSETIAESTDVSDGDGSTAKLDEKDTSSVASTTSAISSQASYEQVASGTVILEVPKRGDFASGSGGDAQFQRALILHQNQKDLLNSYYKTQVKTNLYKV